MELIDYIMLPEGLIKSRSEALAVEIVQSLVKQQVTECHLLVAMNGAFVFYAHLL
jgi:hypoxanthine-guanine phosphoribosyltransferase